MSSSNPEATDAPKRQVYVRCNGRPLRATVSEVIDFFAACGKPTAIMNKWGEEKEAKDDLLQEVVLASFKKTKAFEKALSLTGSELAGRQVVIGVNTKPPRAKGGATGSARVFVGNLPFDATEAAVRAHFAACGRILFVRWATGADGGTKGFCHVIFEDPSDSRQGQAQRAAIALNGSELDGREITVAPAEQKAKPQRGSKRACPAVEAEAAETKKKAMRPADWRHDRSAGLTMPRNATGWDHDA